MTAGFEIVPYNTPLNRTRGWTDLNDGERKRRAVEAARDRNLTALWELTEARLVTWGRSGARTSPATLEAYRISVQQVVAAASGVNLLAPPRDFGVNWIRSLEAIGKAASTVSVRLAGARALWAGLRWAGATTVDPFTDVRAARDLTAAWDKRQPYSMGSRESKNQKPGYPPKTPSQSRCLIPEQHRIRVT